MVTSVTSSSSYSIYSSYYTDSGFSECSDCPSSCSICESDIPSTPLRRSAHGHALRKHEVMDPAVRKEVEGKVCKQDIPLVAFVKSTYGLDDETVDRILNTKFTFPAAPLQEYKSIIEQHKYEHSMYKPFKAILDDFFKTVCAILDVDIDEDELLASYEKKGRHVVYGVQKSQRKPDDIIADSDVTSNPKRIVWQLVPHYFEFKKQKYYAQNSKGQVHAMGIVYKADEGASAAATSVDAANLRPLSALSADDSTMPTSRGPDHPRTPSEVAVSGEDDRTIKAKTTASGGVKRSAPNDHYTASRDSGGFTNSLKTTSSHKRQRITTAICQELQAAHYALECMDAETSRRYVTGVCIDDYKVWLMYHNRSHVFRTTHFNFHESPHLLALVVYALVRCTPTQAGFDPLLHFPIKGEDGTVSYSSEVTYPRNLVGACFVFPEGNGQPAATFIIQSPPLLFKYQGLLGRGTMIYLAKKPGDDRKEYVVKVGHTSHGRELEPVILKRLRKTLPSMQKHFPVVEAWRAFGPLALCGLLMLVDEATRDALIKDSRTIVYQVTLRLRPLWELDSVEEFADCYIDIVEMHYHAYEYARTLHRDISETNAMSRIVDGKAVGLLNDWDLACFVNEHGISEATPTQHRAGTAPFMAVDLQYVTNSGKLIPQYHRYHHDLESLFWLLAWAMLHFDIANKRRLDCKVASWGKGTWEDAARFKTNFLAEDCNTMEDYHVDVLPPFKDLAWDWVMPLAAMFQNARKAATKKDKKDRHYKFDPDSYAKEVTFEKFMETIQRKPRKWSHRKAE
ncbi:hypothetical protein C8Q78DRAFT_1147672 [Trametes maxima]|nr:hypothetical protein C8Q78DRAFT_1147672 [Trametes maxima]